MKYKQLLLVLGIIICGACSKADDLINVENSVNQAANRKATGSSANDLLSDVTFTNMIIEVVYVEGFEPSQTSINNLKSFLEQRVYKPGGIIIEKRAIPSPNKSKYSIQDISEIEKKHRKHYNTKNRIAVWAYFSDGKSDKDSEAAETVVLGTAYWNTSFVIFQETISNFTNSPFKPSRSLLETTVLTHEFGHILGLTNLGSPMQVNHEDDTHSKHCEEENCLMYWKSSSGAGIFNMVNKSTAPKFDANCIADLRTNGGK
ncbi:MAG: membrane metalloprotease [Gelidibacter sp.]